MFWLGLWPPCVADADIIFSSCGFFYLSSFFFYLFSRLFSAVAHLMSIPFFHTWCGLTANLGCTAGVKRAARSSLKYRTDAKYSNNLPSGHHRTTLSGYILATKAVSTIEKKTWVELSWVGAFIIGAELTTVAAAPDGGIYDVIDSNISPHVLTIWRTSAH